MTTQPRCPDHGIPDCSPLLNGCSWKHPGTFRHLVAPGMLLHRGGTTLGAVGLCGYTWVPVGADDAKATCPTCDLIALRG